ncbi:hypothetical protein GCM10008983_06580 [Lentibacillus halophilus]|uniref:Scaffolding protein n=1 Tax=Lentibacillus halophilus TaxID=295065 RepID=A0ABN0Z4G6_9BACI
MAEENPEQQEQQGQGNQEQEQEQVETVNKADYDKVVAERDDLLQYKPHEPSEEEQQFQQQKQELFDEKVNLQLEKNGLSNFKDVIKVNDEDELNNTIKSLNKIVKQVKLDSGYVPEQHAKDDEYSKFEKNGNTEGMIGTKLAKLFK